MDELTDIPADAEPGHTEQQVEIAIRDLRRLVGYDNAREFVAYVLARESGARWQTIEHERNHRG